MRASVPGQGPGNVDNRGDDMSSEPYNPTSTYQPESIIGLPALYRWPFSPRAALKYLLFSMLFPWGYLFIGLGVLGCSS